MKPCPLVFEPIYKPKIWGARNLERFLGRRLPPGEAIGESWECADLESGGSVVARGPAQGKTLHQLIAEWGSDLLGRKETAQGRFPLLIKFLDAAQDLSVQVHPAHDSLRPGGGWARFKNEAWYVLAATETAHIYRGLKPGVTLAALAEAARNQPQAIIEMLQRIPVRSGDMFYLPGGTIHALGAGCVVAEVQTPSDTTYRLYDWGRVRPSGDAGLHVEEGLGCVQVNPDFARHEQRSHVSSVFTTVTRMVKCPNFTIEKVRFSGGVEQEIPYAEPVLWIVLEGGGEIVYNGDQTHSNAELFRAGEVMLLPAGLVGAKLRTADDSVWLEVTMPPA